MVGNLERANDKDLYCATQYGELVHTWVELPPAEIIKLAAHYAGAPADGQNNRERGRRYLRLAAFARQYGSDKIAADAARRAGDLLPGEAGLIRDLFGED